MQPKGRGISLFFCRVLCVVCCVSCVVCRMSCVVCRVGHLPKTMTDFPSLLLVGALTAAPDTPGQSERDEDEKGADAPFSILRVGTGDKRYEIFVPVDAGCSARRLFPDWLAVLPAAWPRGYNFFFLKFLGRGASFKKSLAGGRGRAPRSQELFRKLGIPLDKRMQAEYNTTNLPHWCDLKSCRSVSKLPFGESQGRQLLRRQCTWTTKTAS